MTDNTYVKACSYCNKEFTTQHKGQLYCSKKCAWKVARGKASEKLKLLGRTLKCPVCGKEFVTKSSRATYCCEKCKRTAARTKARHSERKRDRVCPVCGKAFESYSKTCCSRECRKVWDNQNREKYLASLEPKVCEICGKTFKPRNKKQRYCSEKCRNTVPVVIEVKDDKDFMAPTQEEADAMGVKLPVGGIRSCLRCGKKFYSRDIKRNRLCLTCNAKRKAMINSGYQYLDTPEVCNDGNVR